MTITYRGPQGNVNDPEAQAAVAQLAAIRASLVPASSVQQEDPPKHGAIYTAGYGAGWSPTMLADVLDRHAAILLDIRLKPWSKTPTWQKSALQARLGMSRYLHVPALGNLNYNTGGPIALQASVAGIRIVGEQLERRNVVLLCGCRDLTTCHRKVAAELLREALGAPIVHLEPK